MKQVEINLHGKLGKELGKASWGLCVSSVSESLFAINKQSGGKLFMLLAEAQKQNQKYKILINDEPWKSGSDIRFDRLHKKTKQTKKQLEGLKDSELTIKNPKLKKIDIVPVVEGADEVFTIILAILIIIVGIYVGIKFGWEWGAMIIMAGIGLLAAGISALLMDPPAMDEIRTLEGATSSSYLFNGPVNITREGGPVPVCYGQLLVGSQTLSAYYDVEHKIAAENQVTN
jgi:predicted phage tail protein